MDGVLRTAHPSECTVVFVTTLRGGCCYCPDITEEKTQSMRSSRGRPVSVKARVPNRKPGSGSYARHPSTWTGSKWQGTGR